MESGNNGETYNNVNENNDSKNEESLMIGGDNEVDEEISELYYLAKFRLYETRANFYMVGRDKSKKIWRILKIDRSTPSEIHVFEDPTTYTYLECSAVLKRIDQGNMHIGGLKFITICYGIVGFIKFLGPYYMVLITERRKVGMICGHAIYAVSKSKMIPFSQSSMRSHSINTKNENRYKKLLSTVDITKDFFFSYSYRIMHSLQKNLCDQKNNYIPYETMFVWNAYLTRKIRTLLGNTLWTVALIHGFFKQIKVLTSQRTVNLTIIARRSRHYAGTRYLKRGINDKGRAANDVETEQIVFEEIPCASVTEITSVVQIRGSIPLFWSQETSKLNLRPEIILSKEDPYYMATRRHFENLVHRYGNPIFILNLIKTKEKKPRESILHAEFVKAITSINRTLDKEDRLKFHTVDLTRLYHKKGDKVLLLLTEVAEIALAQTGFFLCQVPSAINFELPCSLPSTTVHEDTYTSGSSSKTTSFQSGVLRTNCIDCLDRTNVAQYAFGLIALGHQLHAIGINPSSKIDLDDTLAKILMGLYEDMGDTIALQYGGSAAHSKIFSDHKGHWKAATQSQEFIRTLQRCLNNVYMDPEKQDAINLFLGHFQPEVGKPALWELDSDQHLSIGKVTSSFSGDIPRLVLKRSLSDGALYDNDSPSTPAEISNHQPVLYVSKEDMSGFSESTDEIATYENIRSYTRFPTFMAERHVFTDMLHTQYIRGDGNEMDCSDIYDLDWISSSGNSFEEDIYDRSSLLNSSGNSSFHGSAVHNGPEGNNRASQYIPTRFSDSFVKWVEFGSTLA